MSFDSSRFTFNPWNDFSGVVMQQGRVQLDSDWNEWLAELTRRIRAGTLDTLGRAVYPATTPNAFLIQGATDSSGKATISIGVGRMYVDGLLVENHGLPAPQSGGWIPPAVAPAAAQPGWDDALVELVGQNAILYTQQPYYPALSAGFQPFPDSGGPYLIYLDVWQREVTFLEDPGLIEKAVAVDTTGRMQTVWQVRYAQVGATDTCSTLGKSINWHPAPSAGRLSTGVVQSSPAGVCCLTPNTGYTGTENQLYRVEIHKSGIPTAATFKWSRDNASVASPVTAIHPGTNTSLAATSVLTVPSLGRDHVLSFAGGNWIEIIDDYLELDRQPGELHKIDSVDSVGLTITLVTPVSASFPANANTDPARHTRIQRWDQSGKVFQSDGTTVATDLDVTGTGDIPVPAAGISLILENGVTVSFGLDPSGTQFNQGDFWTFAARTVDGTVENLVLAPPAGIHHHYARLAVLTLPITATNQPSDCRVEWPPAFAAESCCTMVVQVGDDIQKAIDSLDPKIGGCICLKAGVHAIPATLQIRDKQNIMFHGESIGAVVQGAPAEPLLNILGAGESIVSDLTIENISFRGTGRITPGLISLQGVNRCAFRHCTISATASDQIFPNLAFYVRECADIEISDCVVSGALGAIRAQLSHDLCFVSNQLAGPNVGGVSGGVIGIEVNASGLLRLQDNLLTDFSCGLLLQNFDSLVTNCSIERNTVQRQALNANLPSVLVLNGKLGATIQTKVFGIVAEVPGCRIAGNVIQSSDPGHGGIFASSAHTVFESNQIVSSVTPKDSSWGSLPSGSSFTSRRAEL